MACLWLLLRPERLICQCLSDRASETTTAPLISGFWIPSMGSRIRQVMSPTTAHLPSRPFTLHSTLRTHFLINCLLLLGLSFGMSPVTVSLLPIAMAITVADFCQCLSLRHCHCRTFTLLLAQLSNKPFLFSQCALACIASCISSSLLILACPLGSHCGVEGKRRERTSLKFCHFALLCTHTVPCAQGSYSLGFTPSCRPAAGGPAPLLIKRRFPPGSPCGVRRKRANALSHLCLTLLCLLLFLFVFAQTCTAQDAHHLLKPLQGVEPKERVLFCHCFAESLSRNYFTHPDLGKDSNLTSAQVCARDLSRRECHQNCQMQSVGSTGPSLPAFCYHFTDTSLSLPHSPLPRLSELTTKDLENPFSASNLSNLTHGSCLLRISSLSASHCLSFCLTLPLGHHVEGSLPQILYLTSSEGGLCHPFSVLYLSHGCSTPISSLSARSGASLSSSDLVCESYPLPIQHLDLKNGDLCLPFSCSNFAFGRSRPSTLVLSPDPKGFCHRSARETFSLAIANLSLKKGSPKTPFSTSNCVIRCHDWLRISHSLGLSPFRDGFCQQTSYLSVACGGTIPLLEFWSSNSSTLCLDGFLTPLHSSN